jgi:hypothetical protein
MLVVSIIPPSLYSLRCQAISHRLPTHGNPCPNDLIELAELRVQKESIPDNRCNLSLFMILESCTKGSLPSVLIPPWPPASERPESTEAV